MTTYGKEDFFPERRIVDLFVLNYFTFKNLYKIHALNDNNYEYHTYEHLVKLERLADTYLEIINRTFNYFQAGINLGEGRGFQPLPYSGRDEVQNLDTQGGSNVTGRYMYRVSGEKPFRGGCTNDTTLSEYQYRSV